MADQKIILCDVDGTLVNYDNGPARTRGKQAPRPFRREKVRRATPYEEFEGEMILRDHLAYDRTKFALVRTFLSICRTSLGLLASGAGLVILQTSKALVALGCVLIVAAAMVMAVGSMYSYRAKRRLDGLG